MISYVKGEKGCLVWVDLEPCAHCRGDAAYVILNNSDLSEHHIACMECGATAKTAEAWNRRVVGRDALAVIKGLTTEIDILEKEKADGKGA